LLLGAVKLMVADPPDVEAEVIVGALGGAAGVILPEAVEAGDVPIAFVAVTVNVSTEPLTNPETVIGLLAPEVVTPPG